MKKKGSDGKKDIKEDKKKMRRSKKIGLGGKKTESPSSSPRAVQPQGGGDHRPSLRQTQTKSQVDSMTGAMGFFDLVGGSPTPQEESSMSARKVSVVEVAAQAVESDDESYYKMCQYILALSRPDQGGYYYQEFLASFLGGHLAHAKLLSANVVSVFERIFHLSDPGYSNKRSIAENAPKVHKLMQSRDEMRSSANVRRHSESSPGVTLEDAELAAAAAAILGDMCALRRACGGLSWAGLFFAYTVMTESVFTHSNLEAMQQFGEGLSESTQEEARSLRAYLDTHRNDMTNALVGLTPRKSFLHVEWPESPDDLPELDDLKWTETPYSSPNVSPRPEASSEVPTGAGAAVGGAGLDAPMFSLQHAVGPKRNKKKIREFFKSSAERDKKEYRSGSPPPTLTIGDKKASVSSRGRSVANQRDLSKELIARIVAWGELEDDADLVKQVRQYAELIQQNLVNAEPGDLLLVYLPQQKRTVIARFVSFEGQSNDEVALFADSCETVGFIAPSRLVVPFPRAMQSILDMYGEKSKANSKFDYAPSLGALVVRPVPNICSRVSKEIITAAANDYVKDYLDAFNLNFDYHFNLLNKREVTLKDILNWKNIDRHVTTLLEKQHTMLGAIEQVRERVQGQIKVSFAELDETRVFVPMRGKSFKELFAVADSVPESFTNAVKRVKTQLNTALTSLERQVRQVLSGERKNELTSWWHETTRTRMMEYLMERGFLLNVTSFDYVNEPPLNFQGVKSNLKLLRLLLNEVGEYKRGELKTEGERQTNNVALVIEELKDLVYPRIEAYVRDCEAVLCDAFRVDTFWMEKFRQLFKERAERNYWDAATQKSLMMIMDDMEYLTEMKYLEDHPEKKVLHIVPISGLCVGRIVRLESEMKTVVEVWGSKAGILVQMTGHTSSLDVLEGIDAQPDSAQGSPVNDSVLPDENSLAKQQSHIEKGVEESDEEEIEEEDEEEEDLEDYIPPTKPLPKRPASNSTEEGDMVNLL